MIENPFLKKAQSVQNCTPMTPKQSKDYLFATMLELENNDFSLDKLRSLNILVIEILIKRIDVLQLPISFTPPALLAVYALSGGNPGKAVTILIDCLTKWDSPLEDSKKDISVSMLASVYPWGFYNEDIFEDYIDNYLKLKKVKWSEIY